MKERDRETAEGGTGGLATGFMVACVRTIRMRVFGAGVKDAKTLVRVGCRSRNLSSLAHMLCCLRRYIKLSQKSCEG